MLESFDTGVLAMIVSWLAFTLTGYVVLAGGPMKGAQRAALLGCLAVVASAATFVALERGFRVQDGAFLALVMGLMAGLGRRVNHGQKRNGDAP
jgi:hypothetical protein